VRKCRKIARIRYVLYVVINDFTRVFFFLSMLLIMIVFLMVVVVVVIV